MAAAHSVGPTAVRTETKLEEARRIREQRRYEIARDVLSVYTANGIIDGMTLEEIASDAVRAADALLAELEK